MNRKRRRLFEGLLQSYLDDAEDKIKTEDGKYFLSRFQIALHGTRGHPETVAIAGYTGLIEGYTEDGKFRYETVLERLGKRLGRLAKEFQGELLVIGSEQPYDEEAEQFIV